MGLINLYKFKMKYCDLGLVKISVWKRVARDLNQRCNTKSKRIFINRLFPNLTPRIDGNKGHRNYEGHWEYSNYGIHVGKDWLLNNYPYFKDSLEHCKIIKELCYTIPDINTYSYKECIKIKKMIAFA